MTVREHPPETYHDKPPPLGVRLAYDPWSRPVVSHWELKWKYDLLLAMTLKEIP